MVRKNHWRNYIKYYSYPSLTITTPLFLVTAGDTVHYIKTLRLPVVFNCWTFLLVSLQSHSLSFLSFSRKMVKLFSIYCSLVQIILGIAKNMSSHFLGSFIAEFSFIVFPFFFFFQITCINFLPTPLTF